jgi:hypothetical protein
MEFKTDIREVIEGSESENTTESVSKAKKLSRRTADITKKKKKKREKYRTLLQKRELSGRRTVCSKEKLSEKPCRKGQRRRI